MNREELPKKVMVISNWKTPLISMDFTNIIQRFKGQNNINRGCERVREIPNFSQTTRNVNVTNCSQTTRNVNVTNCSQTPRNANVSNCSQTTRSVNVANCSQTTRSVNVSNCPQTTRSVTSQTVHRQLVA